MAETPKSKPAAASPKASAARKAVAPAKSTNPLAEKKKPPNPMLPIAGAVLVLGGLAMATYSCITAPPPEKPKAGGHH